MSYRENISGSDIGLNSSVWQTTILAVGHFLAGIGNEFVIAVQAIAKATGDSWIPGIKQRSYEKAAVIIQAETEDPSDYANDVMKDFVALDLRAKIRKGNLTGRVWPLCLAIEVDDGADGLAVGCEIDGDNHGSFQPEVDTATSKYGQLWVAGVQPGNKPLTADVYVYGGTTGHHRVFVMREDAFIGNADDAFMTILYAGSNRIKYQIGPTGLILDGRKVAISKITDANGIAHECLVLQ